MDLLQAFEAGAYEDSAVFLGRKQVTVTETFFPLNGVEPESISINSVQVVFLVAILIIGYALASKPAERKTYLLDFHCFKIPERYGI